MAPGDAGDLCLLYCISSPVPPLHLRCVSTGYPPHLCSISTAHPPNIQCTLAFPLHFTCTARGRHLRCTRAARIPPTPPSRTLHRLCIFIATLLHLHTPTAPLVHAQRTSTAALQTIYCIRL